ncbi:PROTEIN TIFY 6B-LIKE ISOFORM X1 [Salix viminalis]|uniref:Protein TIFY n=1 Tax=Salix viminalis TaxID=40686 RepID=A0A9Q0U0N8_SALVM|nr:PROTEIN TIFY 6B-LIKE ISOFORM X1 [Salix viminalis]
MERDFLGLSSKNPSAVVKEEISTDGRRDTGFTTGSRMQWPFSNKVSSLHNLMSLKVAQEDKTKTIESDALVSSGFMSILSADACERSAAEIQMFPVTDHAISISTGNPFFNNQYPATGQNTVGTTMKPQLLGGFPVTAPLSILPMAGPVAGVTDSSVKASGSPAQLTIFYAGTVNIFDDISPEKAQAIMFLAGNGSSIPSNSAQPKVQVQAYSSKSAVADVSAREPTYNVYSTML